MGTTEQEKDGKRMRRMIARRSTASLMNDTKWRKLFRGFAEGAGPNVEATFKYIHEGRVHGPSLISWWTVLAERHFVLIEWLDLHHQSREYLGAVAGLGAGEQWASFIVCT